MIHHVLRLAAAVAGVLRFESQSVAATGEGDAKWNKLFPVDTTRFRRDFPGGRITLTRSYLQSFVRNWEKQGKVALPVDYWHDDESPDSIASGWIEDLELRADGLYARIKWTAAAKAKIDADELRFLSPSFVHDGTDSTTGQRQGPTLLGAALLNKPFLFDLPRVAAGAVPRLTHTQENDMDKKLICAALGMPEDTADDALIERMKSLVSAGAKMAADVEAKVELAAKPFKVELSAAREQVTKLQATVAKLEAEKAEAEVATFLGQLEAEKKLLPANRDTAKEICLKLGIEFAKKHFAAAAPVVPEGEKGFKGEDTTKLSREQATAAFDAEIARLQKENPNLSVREARRILGQQKPELLRMSVSA